MGDKLIERKLQYPNGTQIIEPCRWNLKTDAILIQCSVWMQLTVSCTSNPHKNHLHIDPSKQCEWQKDNFRKLSNCLHFSTMQIKTKWKHFSEKKREFGCFIRHQNGREDETETSLNASQPLARELSQRESSGFISKAHLNTCRCAAQRISYILRSSEATKLSFVYVNRKFWFYSPRCCQCQQSMLREQPYRQQKCKWKRLSLKYWMLIGQNLHVTANASQSEPLCWGWGVVCNVGLENDYLPLTAGFEEV